MQPPLIDEQVRRNKQKTALVFVLMGLLLVGVIGAAGVLLALPWYVALGIGVIGGGIYLLITSASSVSAILAAARARPANPQIREEKLLTYRVEEMAIAAGIPAPKVYIQESRDINAFATGRNPKEAVVCFTTGALAQLKQEELEGVVAHELSHIKNYDVRLATITIAVVGMIALLAEIVLRFTFYRGGHRGGGGRGGGQAALILLVISILLIVLAPIFSRLVYFAMSRRREYLADATGAMLTRNPEGLAGALNKILHDAPDDPKGSRTISSLYFANPYLRRHRDNIWSTHPPLEKRIAILTGRPYQPAEPQAGRRAP
ncbi:MAG: M48 family metallopeptidase [Euryarchaeota archaeon]|nr:M48 family metallopeptidase [Euryarchaeota archaeon]